MAQELKVQVRPTRGKRSARRQRREGGLPAVLYGHGQEPVSLTVSAEELDTAIRHGARLVKLTGQLDEQAFVREVQWDTWGVSVLHVDFTRVSEHEKVRVEVMVELRGEAPGIKAGGVLAQMVHQVEVECEATAIPEKLLININHLELDQAITVAQMPLPVGVVVLEEPETIVVQCMEPVEEGAAEAASGIEAEPELIGRKKEEEEEE